MPIARVLAQAKINLMLRVGARDESGYHAVETLFQRIDLSDDVVVRVGGSSRSIDVDGPRLPATGLGTPEKNLALQAAVAFADDIGWPRTFSIELTKNIPVGGGLGGGSSDAGAVLRALNAMAPQPLDADALVRLAGKLGADVPFFTLDQVGALATGRGDVLLPAPTLQPRSLLLAVPPYGVATADAYRWLDEARSTIPDLGEGVATAERWGWELISELSTNDFEPVVEQRHPQLRGYRERLRAAGASIARLSGSGSTVFGVFNGDVPDPRDLALDALVLRTRTSTRVVQVEVQE